MLVELFVLESAKIKKGFFKKISEVCMRQRWRENYLGRFLSNSPNRSQLCQYWCQKRVSKIYPCFGQQTPKSSVFIIFYDILTVLIKFFFRNSPYDVCYLQHGLNHISLKLVVVQICNSKRSHSNLYNLKWCHSNPGLLDLWYAVRTIFQGVRCRPFFYPICMVIYLKMVSKGVLKIVIF